MVLFGSAGGFAISFLLTPVLSRLFTPQAFGLSAAIVALASIFVGLSTLRLEVIAQRVKTEDEAESLLSSALWVDLVVATAITITSLPVIAISHQSWWWACLGPLVFVTSWQLVGSARLTRSGSYGRLAAANFAQGAGLGGGQAALGVLSPSVGSLVAGYFLARTPWLFAIPGRGHDPLHVRQALQRHRVQALQAGGSAFLNGLSTQILPLVITVAYGHAEVGLVAMAIRLLVAPLGIVAQAVSSSAVGHAGQRIRDGRLRSARLVVHGAMRDQALLGLIPCVVAAILAPMLAQAVLGDSWRDVGWIVTIMSGGAWAQFVGSPFAQIMNLTGHSAKLLRWDAVRLGLLIVAAVVPTICGATLLMTLACFALAQMAVYALLVRDVSRALGCV